MKHLTATQINDSILSVSSFVFGVHQFGADRIVDIQSSGRSHELKKEVRMSSYNFSLLLLLLQIKLNCLLLLLFLLI
jgi:hypothetical protein